MFLVVGLGNPGAKYEDTRHNVGFAIVDALRQAAGLPDYAPRFAALSTRGQIDGTPVVLLKPQTYMNASGDSVQPAAAFFRVPATAVVVVHDELDLPWREVRLKAGGGHAGHNGLRSIVQRLGADFVRVRVGIGRPNGRPDAGRAESAAARCPSPSISEWVLSRFDAAEKAELPGVCAEALAAIRALVREGPDAARACLATNSGGC